MWGWDWGAATHLHAGGSALSAPWLLPKSQLSPAAVGISLALPNFPIHFPSLPLSLEPVWISENSDAEIRLYASNRYGGWGWGELERQPHFLLFFFLLMASGKHVLFMYSEIRQRYVFLLTDAWAVLTAYTTPAVHEAYLPSAEGSPRLTANYSAP